ncbi:MAG: hypothetical protein JAY85_04035 [Candidatus Thiodiazotropha weberae]|uniref:RNase A-like domain-containing protein n=1 Tax=Candidatus Thiodiazotropha endoloripes TaxID=1818881 RepID=UPI00114D21C8|nr:RNase A-like domain-containing protein [Candidatus Thiodiazotropha endoloripes]MCG7897608.1 hypothetical protein [Candidatus Thiodiazotropha weberae]MCG7900810.1 hypothetical protein [Candidatus Thiodiazotropha weberae]
MSTPNLYTNNAPAQSYTAVNSGMERAQQSEGEILFQQASRSHQPDVLVKHQFEQRNQNQKRKVANEFISSAGREGISQLAATPDGQYALVVVYDHAGSDGRGLMRQVHEEQGNTAVNYTGKRNESPSGESDDPLSVSDAGVDIGPRPTPLQYAAMTSGVGYGLAENTVKGLVQLGVAVGKKSPDLKNVDNLEYAGIDEYHRESREPGLTLPNWEDVGNAFKGDVQATNEAVKTAKEQGEYFVAGKVLSNNPMLQMTGLVDMAVFGALASMGKVAKLDSLVSENAKINGAGSAGRSQVNAPNTVNPSMVKQESGGTLIYHENFGGHPVSKHVGKTDQELIDRIVAEPHIPSSSSFTNLEIAEKAVGDVLAGNRANIQTWLAGNDRQLPLSMNLGYEVGRKVLNGSTTVQASTDITVLLRRDPLMPNGYRIHTAYPE